MLFLTSRSVEITEPLSMLFKNMLLTIFTSPPLLKYKRYTHACIRYDLLIDDDLKPWLVEVNASPSLAPSTPADRMMKLNLIRDVYRVVVPPDPAGWAEWRGAAHRGPMQV